MSEVLHTYKENFRHLRLLRPPRRFCRPLPRYFRSLEVLQTFKDVLETSKKFQTICGDSTDF